MGCTNIHHHGFGNVVILNTVLVMLMIGVKVWAKLVIRAQGMVGWATEQSSLLESSAFDPDGLGSGLWPGSRSGPGSELGLGLKLELGPGMQLGVWLGSSLLARASLDSDAKQQ